MQDKLRAYYLPLLQQHGPTARGVGWSGEEMQQLRHEILIDMPGLRPEPEWIVQEYMMTAGSVLDVGCGYGKLRGPLSRNGFYGRYIGIDALPEMIEIAKRLPRRQRLSRDIKLDVGDVRSGNYEADYVLASGIFALSDWAELCEVVAAMWRACRSAVTFNFLTDGDGLGPETHFDPYDVLRECRKHTPWCTLRMDYHPRDATVYMHREARG